MSIPIPFGGLAGWRFLERTMDRQLASAAAASNASRQLKHLRQVLPTVRTVNELLDDRTLTRTVFAAFGLESEVTKTAFMRRILSEDPNQSDAIVRRLSDKRFERIARALGFGDPSGPNLARTPVISQIAQDFVARRVEVAAGEVDPALRFALNFKREIAPIAGSPAARQAGWYQVMGNTPLRQVIETAFGLPTQAAQIDLEAQRRLFEAKARSLFGDASPEAFLKPANVNKVIELYILRRASLDPPTAPILRLLSPSGASPLTLLLARGQG